MAMQRDFWVKDGVWGKVAVLKNFWVKNGTWREMGVQRDFGLKLVFFWGEWPCKGTLG